MSRLATSMYAMMVILCAPLAPSFAQDRTPGAGGRTDSEIVERLEKYLAEQASDGFSGIVLVVKGNDVLVKRGYGLANRETSRKFDEKSVFTVGSISKQFTGAAIMKLVMEGRLSVDDPIEKFFKKVPKDKRGITVHQLLTHTGGFTDGLGGDFDTRATSKWIEKEAMKTDLRREPGTRHIYSNLGYSLLGIIVEKVSGQSYEAYLREHLFLPAGMAHTGYVLPNYDDADIAVAYRKDRPWGTVLEKRMLVDGPSWNLRANGGIHSTIDDILKWHWALRGNELLSAKAKEAYFAPHADEGGGDTFYGYGWVNWTTGWDTRLLSHNGGNGYFSADFHRYIEDDAAIFVAANGDDKAWDLMDDLEIIAFDCE